MSPTVTALIRNSLHNRKAPADHVGFRRATIRSEFIKYPSGVFTQLNIQARFGHRSSPEHKLCILYRFFMGGAR
jgi:hypothetical protein